MRPVLTIITAAAFAALAAACGGGSGMPEQQGPKEIWTGTGVDSNANTGANGTRLHHDRDLEIDADRAERCGNHDHAIHRCARDLRLLSPEQDRRPHGNDLGDGADVDGVISRRAQRSDACVHSDPHRHDIRHDRKLAQRGVLRTRLVRGPVHGRDAHAGNPRPRTESEALVRPALPESRAAPARLRRVRLAGRHEAHRRPATDPIPRCRISPRRRRGRRNPLAAAAMDDGPVAAAQA